MKNWLFEKINKIDKEKEKAQTTTIRNETGDITTDPADIKRLTKKKTTNNSTQKFDNLYEIDQFLERHKVLKLTQGEINNLIISISI